MIASGLTSYSNKSVTVGMLKLDSVTKYHLFTPCFIYNLFVDIVSFVRIAIFWCFVLVVWLNLKESKSLTLRIRILFIQKCNVQ